MHRFLRPVIQTFCVYEFEIMYSKLKNKSVEIVCFSKSIEDKCLSESRRQYVNILCSFVGKSYPFVLVFISTFLREKKDSLI